MSVLDAETTATIRASLEQVFVGEPSAITDALGELGWSEVVEADPVTAQTLLFGAQGRALAASRLLDEVALAALDEGFTVDRTAVAYGDILLGAVEDVDTIVLLDVDRAAVATAADAGTHVRSSSGFDPGGSWQVLDRAEVPSVPLELEPDAVAAAVAAVRLALTAEIIGACETALEMCVRHTTAREQYGRPLATFQVVRHALAESHAAVELTRATLTGAQDADPALAPLAARVAKHRAGATHALVMRHAIQVHGAMGLTLESDVHRAVTRAAALDSLMGSHHYLARQLGHDLVSGAQPPLPIVEI
jgi:hypothetical protein